MRLSISIKESSEGFTPRLVLEKPKYFKIIPAGEVCSTFKEAWILARLKRDTIHSGI